MSTQHQVFRENLLMGKTAFIAGGTSGINLEIAHTFARFGARVAVLSRKPEKVDAAVAALKAHGGEVSGHAADVREYEAVDAALQRAKVLHGAIDIVVSGAAGNFVAPAAGLSANGFRSVVEIDLLGTFNVFRASYGVLAKPGASLIAISAPQSTHPFWGQSHVCAAKAGVDMLAKCLAAEWGCEGIRVNAIVPGPIEGTEGMQRLAPTPEIYREVVARVPLRRFGQKSEVADMALFLSSPAAAYVTGGIFNCDGGQTLTGGSNAPPAGLFS